MSAPRHRYAHEAMATVFELHLVHEDELIANGAAQAVFSDVDRLERELSRFIPYSDIARINDAAAGETVEVEAACMDCLSYGKEIWQATSGAFDVTIGPLYAILRNPDGTPRKASKDELADAKARSGYHLLELDPDNLTVTPKATRMKVDLGAIGKGYALDQAVFTLREWEISDALLNAGDSTVLAMGSMPGRDFWPVLAGEGDPIPLRDQALSGTGFEQKGAHIIDPRTFRTVNTDRILRWSIAPGAALADALSTAFMVMSKKEIDAFCKAHPDTRAILLK